MGQDRPKQGCAHVTGFAGSQRLDERRRRRLAANTDSAASGSKSASDSAPLWLVDSGPAGACLTADNCPLLAAISTRVWKHWLVSALVLFVGAGILAFSLTAARWESALGSDALSVFRGPQFPLLTWYLQLLAVLSAQVTFVVWWGRSRSQHDFAGAYPIWGWAAVTWGSIGVCLATGAHGAIADVILHFVRWQAPLARIWCWLPFVAFWCLGLGFRLNHELQSNGSSRALLLVAGICGVVGAGALIQAEAWPQLTTAFLSQGLQWGCALVGLTALLTSMTLHARYVLYVSADPPKAAVKAAAGERRSWWNWIRACFQRSEDPAAESQPATPRSRKRSSAKEKSRETTRRPRRSTKKAAAVPEVVEEEETEDVSAELELVSDSAPEEEADAFDTSSSEEEFTAEAAESDNTGAYYRVDDPEDGSDGPHYGEAESSEEADPYRGLSKKQRRRLQAEARELQRRGGR